MKCPFCNARIKPNVTLTGIKYCPKCELIIGGKDILKDKPKDKQGKYQPHLVCSSLVRAIARVREYGVKKYNGENGWKQQIPEDYMDAIGRHYDACRNDPKARDSESGLLHICQIATDAMFVIDMLKKQGEDIDIMKEPNNAN